MNHRAYRPYSGKRKKGIFLRIVLALFLVGVLCFGILTGIIAALSFGSRLIRKKKIAPIPLIGISAALGILIGFVM